jgi:hypothetical protein
MAAKEAVFQGCFGSLTDVVVLPARSCQASETPRRNNNDPPSSKLILAATERVRYLLNIDITTTIII